MGLEFSTPSVLIALALVVIVSYLFNLVSRATRIPSVLMLLGMGLAVRALSEGPLQGRIPDVQPLLEVLGSIGLIMIVLEAALDLELVRENRKMIWGSLNLTLAEMGVSTVFVAAVLHYGLGAGWAPAIVYALPLAILSSAIVIPSVENLRKHSVKEFMIYQSTVSDILGIMLFYFVTEGLQHPTGGWQPWLQGFLWSFGGSIVVSAVFAYALVLLLQHIRTSLKMFLLIAVLILLYAVGKMLHLSSLLVILFFGLMLRNPQLFFIGFLKRWINMDVVRTLLGDFQLITRETAFIVRTFFFVVFGFSIALGSLTKGSTIFLSALVVVGLLYWRATAVKVLMPNSDRIIRYMAPRGLITILLFYSIPAELQLPGFDRGLLLYVILASNVYMAWGMVRNRSLSEDKTLREVLQETGAVAPGSVDPVRDEEVG
ncbi:MAG: cation:proton antiporter [Schleiferiaceae bacterium]